MIGRAISTPRATTSPRRNSSLRSLILPSESTHVQQVVHQPRHVRELAVDHVAVPAARAAERLQPCMMVTALRRAQRIAQLVRQHGQEFVHAPAETSSPSRRRSLARA